MMRYFPAPEVKKLAEELIPLHHPHLIDARIDYIFCDKITKKGGKDIWGTMRKITNLNAYLGSPENEKDSGYTTPFFVMIIAAPVWENLNTDNRKALIEHELCHAGLKLDDEGDAKISIIPHDLEEFACIVKRYGLWRESVRAFVESANEGDVKGESAEEVDEDETT